MTGLSAFNTFTGDLKEQDLLMPVLFIGHGSPMNSIEDNGFSQRWAAMAKEIHTPAAVLVVSANWLSRGTKITAMDFPRTIHYFGGFPKALFDVQYNVPGNPLLAAETASVIQSTQIEMNRDWGPDHGTWTVVRHMYPEAKIPVLQLSIDYTKGAKYHYNWLKNYITYVKKVCLLLAAAIWCITWGWLHGIK